MSIDAHYQAAQVISGLQVVDDVLTPLPDVEAAGAMVQAFRYVFGKDIARRALCCLVAQCALETGHWRYCHHHNWGNVKASDTYRGSCCYFRCNEILAGKTVWFDPFNPACRFRAFATAAGGAEQYLRFLGTATNGQGRPNRYGPAWTAAMAGDPIGFVDELAHAGYFTANKTVYLDGVQKLFAHFLGTLPSTFAAPVHEHEPEVMQPTSGHSPFTDEDIGRILSLQLPLTIDWDQFRAERDALIRDELMKETT